LLGSKKIKPCLPLPTGGAMKSITGIFVEGPMEVQSVEATKKWPIEHWGGSSWERSRGEQEG
jgi:hypothetical protein